MNILKSLGFNLGVFLLLVNDFVLKELFNNWFTGRLSDFVGLFIFPLFWIALFPKHALEISYFIAIFFVFWKSEFSERIIEVWNSFGIMNIDRVVNNSDTLAYYAADSAERSDSILMNATRSKIDTLNRYKQSSSTASVCLTVLRLFY